MADESADEVSGLLLSAAAFQAPAHSASDPVDVTAPDAREAQTSGSIDPAVWWSLAVPALLAFGAWSERRPRAPTGWGRRRRFRRVHP